MNNPLEENLPLAEQRKSVISVVKKSGMRTSLISLRDQKSNGSEETQDEEFKYLTTTKRIRNLDPISCLVTIDGHTFPTASDDTYVPVHLLNLSSRVTRLIVNKTNGAITYCVAPQFDSGNVLPWKAVTERLKSAGDQDYYNLANSFEKFAMARDEYMKKFQTDPDILNFYGTLKAENLSTTVPQIAEVRAYYPQMNNVLVTRMILNKPMQKLLGIDSQKANTELHTGIRYLRCANQADSIRLLTRYYEFYTKKFATNFLNQAEENLLLKLKRISNTGVQYEMEVTGHAMLYEGSPTWVYSYNFKADESSNMMAIEDLKESKSSTSAHPQREEELSSLLRTKQAALAFGRKFQYINKNLYEEPSKDRVCRIREINRDKINVKTE